MSLICAPTIRLHHKYCAINMKYKHKIKKKKRQINISSLIFPIIPEIKHLKKYLFLAIWGKLFWGKTPRFLVKSDIFLNYSKAQSRNVQECIQVMKLIMNGFVHYMSTVILNENTQYPLLLYIIIMWNNVHFHHI